MILIANGSFLLNLPLVNHEHRKLAARLVESVGSAKRIIFLASYDGGTVRTKSSNQDDSNQPHSMVDIFGIWPLSVILTQWGLVLLLLCFSRWPIFGPPRDPPAPTASDFSRHVNALGEARIDARRGICQSPLATLSRTSSQPRRRAVFVRPRFGFRQPQSSTRKFLSDREHNL